MKDGSAPIVVALGGNAISPVGEVGNIAQQFRQTRQTVAGLRRLLVGGAPMIITHGNGPQVGNAIRRVELSAHEVYPLDLGICVADVQGGMGYMIAQCLMNDLQRQGRNRIVTTIVTTVEVDRNDEAFSHPSKPIGSFFPREQAERYMREYGWEMVEIPRQGHRRVVPSPRPIAIVEIDLIRKLVESGELLVAVGGGGIPVYREANGDLEGCEAVIDKDLASGLLAGGIGAATLFIVTAVDKVCLDYGTPAQRKLDRLTAAEARRHLDDGQFPPGSMGPKIQAAINFLEASQREDARVIICDIEHISPAMDGEAGTVITRG
ncbi:MAG: carbamate kinase [Planctomycetota bacterium]|nr:carbamate kinase [Planctomycetota bacterium]